jgi:hypothetical protein
MDACMSHLPCAAEALASILIPKYGGTDDASEPDSVDRAKLRK